MKTFSSRAVVLTAALLLGSNAMADDNFWFGVKAGTLGIGLEASWARQFHGSTFGPEPTSTTTDDSGSQAGINYDATLALETFYATANFRFPLSPFRMTVGAYSNGNEIELVSQPMGSYEIGGIPYSPTEVGTLRSSSTFENFAPYLGAGFDFTLSGRLGLALDFGVLWQGDPIVTLTSDGSLANDPDFLLALDAERQQLESEVEDFKAYPVVSIGFNFNF